MNCLKQTHTPILRFTGNVILIYIRLHYNTEFFFHDNHMADERPSHVKNEVDIDVIFEDTHVVSTWETWELLFIAKILD